MGLIIKPCKLNLTNGTNLEVLMVTDASQSSHPEICPGDIIGGINNNAIVAKEGTNWQQFYSGALNWVKSNQDVVKNLKLFRRTPGQPVLVTDGRLVGGCSMFDVATRIGCFRRPTAWPPAPPCLNAPRPRQLHQRGLSPGRAHSST